MVLDVPIFKRFRVPHHISTSSQNKTEVWVRWLHTENAEDPHKNHLARKISMWITKCFEGKSTEMI